MPVKSYHSNVFGSDTIQPAIRGIGTDRGEDDCFGRDSCDASNVAFPLESQLPVCDHEGEDGIRARGDGPNGCEIDTFGLFGNVS